VSGECSCAAIGRRLQVVGGIERAPGSPLASYSPEGMNLKALREVVEKIGYKGLKGVAVPRRPASYA